MGIVNASPDSFSDGAQIGDVGAQFERAAAALRAGADVIDIGGESGITGVAAVGPDEEIARVVPLVRRVATELGAIVSVDTYKPAVAAAALEAGAVIINDVSGLRDPQLAAICAEHRAALVVMHTAAPPKVKLLNADLYDDIAEEVADFLEARIELACEQGMRREQLMLDPGPDFAKTPRQTVAVLRRLSVLHERFERPLLAAISRKDFIGAICGRAPHERDAGSLAAVGAMVDAGAHMLRVHDVAGTADYLRVRAALRGEVEVDRDLLLDPALRRRR